MKTKTAISKITSLLQSLILVLGMTPLTAFALEPATQSPESAPLGTSAQPMSGQITPFAIEPEGIMLGTIDGVAYTSLGGGNAIVSGHDPATLPANVVIPATITVGTDVYNVTEIGDSAFVGCTSLESITIPNSVTTIGDSAFVGCTSLESITIPNSVTTIGNYVFTHCDGLTGIIIPDSVITIGKSAFNACIGLTSITISNSLTVIENSAFMSCISLTSITIPNSVTTIKESGFAYCVNLTSLTIPSSVTKIDQYAFERCYSLTAITFKGTTPPTFGTDVFLECNALTTVNVPLGSEAAYKAALPDYESMIVDVNITPPVTPPTSNNSGSSSSGGSNKADVRAVVGGTTTGTTTSKPLTTAEATKLFDTALAAKPAGTTALSIKINNATSVSKDVLAELAALGAKNGVTLTVHFDTIVGGKVTSRLSVNPATATGDLNVAITENKALAARFAKFFSNPLAAYTIPAAGSVAIKLPENLKLEDLVIYSYHAETNTYAQLTGAKPWVDTNGYLHFDVQAAGEIVISQGKLVKK